ncbi:MAG: hypothetical protein ACOYOD_09100 [Saprospiraceae bacterium]
MVTVTDVAIRNNKEGKEFVALVLQGGMELVKSQNTGLFYATARKTSIPSTFTLEVAKSLIGSQIPGTIQRIEVPEYTFVIPETGEMVQLTHSWVFVPEGQQVEPALPKNAVVH